MATIKIRIVDDNEDEIRTINGKFEIGSVNFRCPEKKNKEPIPCDLTRCKKFKYGLLRKAIKTAIYKWDGNGFTQISWSSNKHDMDASSFYDDVEKLVYTEKMMNNDDAGIGKLLIPAYLLVLAFALIIFVYEVHVWQSTSSSTYVNKTLTLCDTYIVQQTHFIQNISNAIKFNNGVPSG